jgi:hypothetical protein
MEDSALVRARRPMAADAVDPVEVSGLARVPEVVVAAASAEVVAAVAVASEAQAAGAVDWDKMQMAEDRPGAPDAVRTMDNSPA